MKIMKRNRKRGFTLIELMTVVIVIGILASIAVPIYRAQIKKAIVAEGIALAGAIRSAERVYFAEHNEYTENVGILGVDTTGNRYFDIAGVTITAEGTGSEATFSAEITGKEGTAAEGFTVTIDQNGNILATDENGTELYKNY